jgi:hypothetical protein
VAGVVWRWRPKPLARRCHSGAGCGGIPCEVSRHARFLTLLPGLLTIAASALAQPGDTPRSEHTDWTGYYVMARGKDLAGLITAHLQPWARGKMESTDGVADDTGQVCLPNGPFR